MTSGWCPGPTPSAGAVVLATPRGLWWPDRPEGGLRLIGWQHISKAVWRDGQLAVTEAEVVDDLIVIDRSPVAVQLRGAAGPSADGPQARWRTTSSAPRWRRSLGGAARFVARRVPGEDGLRWWARLEPGTPDTDQVRSSVAARAALIRAEWEQERPDQSW